MHPDFFTGTFYSLRNSYQEKYNITKSDREDYFFESMFLCSIQILLCAAIWSNDKFREDIGFCNQIDLNVVVFFCTLILHFGCVMTIRNGINMCMYVVYHSDDFDDPEIAFILGIVIIIANVSASITNLGNLLT
jgi:hypothetical protein